MSSQLVSLTWDGHHKTLVSVLEKLLVNSHFVDCTIAAEGQKLKAHREILSAFSPFFELLFSEGTVDNPTVIISGISFGDLKSLVDFMYRGELEVAEDRIQDLIDAAECLQIEGLGGGHKKDDLRNPMNTTLLAKGRNISSGILHKQTENGENEETVNVGCEESGMNSINYSDEIELENSIVVACGIRQFSPVHNLTPDSNVQNVGIVSNISLIPAQSDTEMDSLHLQGEYEVKRELDSDKGENICLPMGDECRGIPGQSALSEVEIDSSNLQVECVVKMEPGSDGDENINEPMREETSVCGICADSIVPSLKSVDEDLPMDCVHPAVVSSNLCSRNFTVSSVNNELCNMNVKSSSECVESVKLGEQAPLLQSEFHMKTENETLLSMDNDLISENDELSENLPESIGGAPVTDMQMKMVCTERRNNCSESTHSPQKFPAMFVKIQRIGRNEPAGLVPGLPAEVNPNETPSPPMHTRPVCDRDASEPSGGDDSTSTDTYRCQICSKIFTHRQSLNGHMRIHSKDRLLRHGECNNAAATSIKLNEQRNECRRKLYECTICNSKSVGRSSFSVHMRIHKGFESYKCTECEFTCAHISKLKIHRRIHDNLKRHQLIQSGVKSYKCTECEYTSSYMGNLKIHQRIHSGIKPYKCTECEYTSAYRSNLNIHKRIHSGVKPYKCTECGYRASQMASLKTHQRVHSGVKPYKCTECDYKATQISHLKLHQRIHSGIKPYKCTECEYTSAYPQNLKVHQRKHRLKSYKCAKCDYSAAQLIDLKKHQRIHSGNNL